MRINDRNLAGTASETARPQETQMVEAGRQTRSAATHGGGDRVEFSGSLGALARAVSSDQSSRASRIAALTAQVQAGKYQPDAAAISRGIVTEGLAGA